MTPRKPEAREVVAVPAHVIDAGVLAFVGDAEAGPKAVILPLATFRALVRAAAHAPAGSSSMADATRVRGATRALRAAERGTLGAGQRIASGTIVEPEAEA